MGRTTRRLTFDQFSSRSRGAARLRRTRLQISLHLVMLSTTASGCVAPTALRPAATTEAPLPTAAAQPVEHRQSVAPLPARPLAHQANYSDPANRLDAHVVPASHIVPAAELTSLPSTQGAAAPQPVEFFIARALQSHPRIAAARLRVTAAAEEMPQARALPDPMWNNTFWPIPDHALQTAGGRMAHQMSLSQQVPWPEKLRARAAIASREVEVARAELEQAEREITEAVRLAYYELWYATEAIEIVEDNRALVSDLIAVAEARYRTGGAQQDVLRAELEAERLEDQLIALRRQREVAQADLGALLQQPVELTAEPVDELNLPADAGQLDQLIGDALACNPELRGLAWQIARDRERERLACLQRYPDFQLGVGWSAVTEDDALSGVANGNDNLNLTLGVTLPVWREKINAGIREAAANTAATARTRDAEQDALYGTIRRLLAEADGLYQQLELYRTRIIPRTEQTLQLATVDYRGERVDFFSLIDIYQELLVYQVQVARMEASLAGTLARLDRAVGCPVDVTDR